MTGYKALLELINQELLKSPIQGSPKELYDPVNYIMGLGGKRLRPVLVLMAHEMFGGDPSKVVQQALAIELFHNFTLVHDDIMDEAPLRRNQPTVHKKWNQNIAILSGDLMLVKAYELLCSSSHENLQEILNLFSKTAAEVCEGQQWDMNFEKSDSVSHEDYINMIGLKTAVLLGSSLKTGAILAHASPENADLIYDYGKNIGIGFQLMDDILDVFGNQEQVGKQPGGDIISNKKTYLLITCIERAKGKDLEELNKWLSYTGENPENKVAGVKALYEKLEVREAAEAEMLHYFHEADKQMDKISLSEDRKAALTGLANQLKVRIS